MEEAVTLKTTMKKRTRRTTVLTLRLMTMKLRVVTMKLRVMRRARICLQLFLPQEAPLVGTCS